MKILLFACMSITLMSCELGVNPLLFDGAPVGATLTARTAGSLYADSTTIALHEILSGIQDNVDSISVINITLQFDSLTNGTLPSTTISGTGAVDGMSLLTLNGIPLSAFAAERSIFDPALATAGVSVNPAAIQHINSVLRNPEALPASMWVGVMGNASRNGLYFQARLKIYTQVFLKK
jgi:hypothetical protein